jgi:hypothetical protein
MKTNETSVPQTFTFTREELKQLIERVIQYGADQFTQKLKQGKIVYENQRFVVK